jgi:hypothetical protein
MEMILNQISELEDNISVRKAWILESLDNEDYMILDREVVDISTFETVRKATEDEMTWFYEIRLSQLKIKELENSLPR